MASSVVMPEMISIKQIERETLGKTPILASVMSRFNDLKCSTVFPPGSARPARHSSQTRPNVAFFLLEISPKLCP